MPSHPAFPKFTLPDSPLLRDQKNKDVQFVQLPLHGHRKTTTTVQTLQFATGRRPGHHQWFRKRIHIVEVVTYSVYDGDLDELTTDSDMGDGDDSDSSNGGSLPRSSPDPSHEADDDHARLMAAADAVTANDVRKIWARIYSDADAWAASALQAIATHTASQPQAGEGTAATVTNSASRGYVIRIPGPHPRMLGSSKSTAIVLSSDDDSDVLAPETTGPSGNTTAAAITFRNTASIPIGSTTRTAIKRGVTLQGGVAGPPIKKAKTIMDVSKAT